MTPGCCTQGSPGQLMLKLKRYFERRYMRYIVEQLSASWQMRNDLHVWAREQTPYIHALHTFVFLNYTPWMKLMNYIWPKEKVVSKFLCWKRFFKADKFWNILLQILKFLIRNRTQTEQLSLVLCRFISVSDLISTLSYFSPFDRKKICTKEHRSWK